MVNGELPLPTFLIIGAERSGTRWLRANLEEHPDVFTPPASLSYFNNRDRMRKRGIKGYRQQFQGWSGEPGTLFPSSAGTSRRPGDAWRKRTGTLTPTFAL